MVAKLCHYRCSLVFPLYGVDKFWLRLNCFHWCMFDCLEEYICRHRCFLGRNLRWLISFNILVPVNVFYCETIEVIFPSSLRGLNIFPESTLLWCTLFLSRLRPPSNMSSLHISRPRCLIACEAPIVWSRIHRYCLCICLSLFWIAASLHICVWFVMVTSVWLRPQL
jgi:hypothetical protein